MSPVPPLPRRSGQARARHRRDEAETVRWRAQARTWPRGPREEETTRARPSPAPLSRTGASENAIERRVVRLDPIEKLEERARDLTHVLGKPVGIKQSGNPAQADRAIDRRRRIDPAEGKPRRKKDALRADCRDRGPDGIGIDLGEKIRVPGHNRVRRPGDDLFHGNIGNTPAAARSFGDVDAAGALDDLGVDGAGQPGLETIWLAREIYPMPLALRNGLEPRVEELIGLLDIAGNGLSALHRSERV